MCECMRNFDTVVLTHSWDAHVCAKLVRQKIEMCGVHTCTHTIGRNSWAAKKPFAWISTTVYSLFRPCDLIGLKSYSNKLLQSNYFKFRLGPFNFLPAFWHTTAQWKFCTIAHFTYLSANGNRGGSVEETLMYKFPQYSKFEFSFPVTLCLPS